MTTFAFRRAPAKAGVALMLATGLAAGLLACDGPGAPPSARLVSASSTALRERPVGAQGFAAAGVCAECHAVQQSAWQGSHHDWAIELATPETVVGDFDGT